MPDNAADSVRLAISKGDKKTGEPHAMNKNLKVAAVLFFTVSFLFLVINDARAVPEKYRMSPDPVAVMADGVLVRPLGLVSTIVGSVFYVITLPFTLPSDSEDSARQQLIEYPAWFTFQRPIGNFGHRYERPNIIQQKKALATSLEEGRKKEKEGKEKIVPE